MVSQDFVFITSVQVMYQIIRAYISGVKMDFLKSKPDTFILPDKGKSCLLSGDRYDIYVRS